jgi:hypothetical protein
MASSKYSGIFDFSDFRNRSIIKLAPDALVYIAGSVETQVIAPVSSNNGTTNFTDGITSISVQNVSDPPGSSNASIEVTTPVYGENSQYWKTLPIGNGNIVRVPVFVPMMEVKIFFKGRYLLKDVPQYYPAFWGFITSVDESYSGGVHKISLRCADILHWWSYSTITTHPIPESNIAAGGSQTVTPYATIFERANPFTVIRRLFDNMGMNEFVTTTWATQMTPLKTIYDPSQLKNVVAPRIMEYWKSRFGSLGGLLKMFGIRGDQYEVVTGSDGSKITKVVEKPVQDVDPNVSDSNELQGTLKQNRSNYTLDDGFLNRFTVFFDFENMGTFDQAEKMTKLEIAINVKNRCDYEFFQDCNGNFIFKPPFYNMDVRGNTAYEIEPYDIINCSFGVETEGICTVLQVYGSMHEQLQNTSFDRPTGYHMDIELAQKFGVRWQEASFQYLAGAKASNLMRQVAVGHMNLINAKTVTGSVTIPGRPEIRMGYPIYIRYRDSFHYVKNITHAFDYGGSFTTTLSLETERKKVFNEQGALLKDRVYVYSGKIFPSDKEPDPPVVGKPTAQQLQLQGVQSGENKSASLAQGRYIIAERIQGSLNQYAITNNSVPFTDEDGYRVVGGFPFGRGLDPNDSTSSDPKFYNKETKQVMNMLSGSLEESALMKLMAFPDKETLLPVRMDPYKDSNITTTPNVNIIPSYITDLVQSSVLVNNQVTSSVAQEGGLTIAPDDFIGG